MAKVYVFNSSSVQLMLSINNGGFMPIESTSDTFDWMPLPLNHTPNFCNQLNPPLGMLGLGSNTLTLYPASSGAAFSATVKVIIPENISTSSIQIYLCWKDAKNIGAVVCNSGQFIQAISLP